MKTVTSVTFWTDAVGKRISVTFSEIDEKGQVISDNSRVDRVVTESKDIKHLDAIHEMAQRFIDEEE